MTKFSAMVFFFCATILTGSGLGAVHDGGKGKSGTQGSSHRRTLHSEAMPGVSPLRPVPITRPVDLVWPPVIIEPPGYWPGYTPVPAESAVDREPAPPEERGVEVRLDDCLENAPMAGYNFSDRRVVSCEDSSVDVYLSFNEDGNYYLLVPEETQIKDIGPRNELRSVRLIKPGNWSPNHGSPLTAGHVYVVWAYSGDMYLVKVDALWEKHAMFSWLWHSHLSREAAEKFLKDNAGGPPPAPYFPR